MVLDMKHRTARTFDFYTEPEDPSPALSVDWTSVTPGLHASSGSIDVHYPRSSVPNIETSLEWRGVA